VAKGLSSLATWLRPSISRPARKLYEADGNALTAYTHVSPPPLPSSPARLIMVASSGPKAGAEDVAAIEEVRPQLVTMPSGGPITNKQLRTSLKIHAYSML